MNIDDAVRWAPRIAVAGAFGVYLYLALAYVAIISAAKPPEGPVLAAVILLITLGAPAYAFYRFDEVRAWFLAR